MKKLLFLLPLVVLILMFSSCTFLEKDEKNEEENVVEAPKIQRIIGPDDKELTKLAFIGFEPQVPRFRENHRVIEPKIYVKKRDGGARPQNYTTMQSANRVSFLGVSYLPEVGYVESMKTEHYENQGYVENFYAYDHGNQGYVENFYSDDHGMQDYTDKFPSSGHGTQEYTDKFGVNGHGGQDYTDKFGLNDHGLQTYTEVFGVTGHGEQDYTDKFAPTNYNFQMYTDVVAANGYQPVYTDLFTGWQGDGYINSGAWPTHNFQGYVENFEVTDVNGQGYIENQ